jgi:GntR family transcriptional regulator
MVEFLLDHQGPISVHEQLSSRLRTEVIRLGAGSKLPTEDNLVQQYEVSRTTVRRALQTLTDEGLLVRRQGKGTFVAPTRPIQQIDRLTPFVSSFTGLGLVPLASLLKFRWMSANDESIPASVTASEGEILFIQRQYSVEGKVQAIAEMYVPEHLGRFISRADIEEHPVYEVLQRQAGRQPHHAEMTITCAKATGEVAKRLGISQIYLTPRIQRVTFDSSNEVLECMVAYLRPDAFEVHTVVTTDQPFPVSYSFSKYFGTSLVSHTCDTSDVSTNDQEPPS